MKLNVTNILILLLLAITASGISLITYRQFRKDRNEYLKGNNIVYHQGDVLGISSEESFVRIDFSNQIAVGSPLVFGGAHSPRHEKAWEEIEDVGVTMVRSDFFLDRFLPKGITLEQYKQNINGIQDSSSWNQDEIQKVKKVFKEAKSRNMQTMGILAYSVNWLTLAGTHYGPAKDWEVYEDLAEKSYRLYREDVDYLEIWNEPDMDFFMNVKNSGMTKDQAYLETVRVALPMIRRVDSEINDGKKMKIGVGVISQPKHTYILDTILADQNIRSQIDFISYHNYEHLAEPSNKPILDILKKYQLENLPIFLTEWSVTPEIKKADAHILSDQGITYVGGKFVDFLNMGLSGANYFSLQPIMPDSKRGDEGYLGIYTTAGESVSMLPMVKSWTLMSKTLGLGSGNSKIYKVDNSDEKISAWRNADGDYGLVVVNSDHNAKQFTFSLRNLPIDGDMIISAYIASKDHDGTQEIGSTTLSTKKNESSFKALAPANSVVGIKFIKTTWIDKLLF